MNARLENKLLHGFSSPAMLRHYLDAQAIPPRRKPYQRLSASLPFALLLVLLAAAALAPGFFR